jgi:hypothetical protein
MLGKGIGLICSPVWASDLFVPLSGPVSLATLTSGGAGDHEKLKTGKPKNFKKTKSRKIEKPKIAKQTEKRKNGTPNNRKTKKLENRKKRKTKHLG